MPAFTSDILPVGVRDLLIALILGTGLSFVLASHYMKLGRTLSNRSRVAYAIPIITLTIILIISVVKSSIALSLGLVGALSIVRFRTPIKEPEELAYLFVSIGIGIGLGSGQTAPTVTATIVILLVMTGRALFWARDKNHNLYVNIDVRGAGIDGKVDYRKITELLAPNVESAVLRRLDVGSDFLQATLYVKCKGDEALAKAVESLKEALPESTTVTFIEQSDNPGI